MGRSKFPGKPSKHVNKKRVTVLPSSIVKSNDISAIQNVHSVNGCYHSEQGTTTSGLDDEKCIETLQHVETQQKEFKIDNESRSKCSSFITNSISNSTAIKEKQNDNIKVKDNETESLNLGNIRRANKSNAFLYNYTSFTVKNNDGVTKSKVKSLKTSKQIIRKSTELNKISKATLENYDSSSAKGTPSSLNRKSMYTKHRAVKSRKKNSPVPSTSNATRLHEKEAASLVGKFVLPSRSLHSSRVIKPNKRFINHEQIHNTNSAECISKTNNKRTKVIGKSIVSYGRNKKSECESANEKSTVCLGSQEHTVQNNKKSLNSKVICSNKKCCSTDEVETTSYFDCSMSESSRDSSDVVVIDNDIANNSNASWTCGKLILRKARLQLHTQSSEGTDGPFSSYSTATTNPPGTVTCGVCGAVRFYRFVKQARKFNIYSCESCRKFISKMIKRQNCAKNCAIPTLVCHKGQGMCHVPPIVRSQQWKLIRCAYKARCPACWLKMCLRSFQMPSQLKLSLTNMLPENMRSFVDYNMSTNNDIMQKKILNSTQHLSTWQTDTFTTDIKRLPIKEKSNKLLEGFISPLKLDSKSHLLSNDHKDKKHRKSRLRVRKKGIMISNQTLINTTSDSTKRQKIDLKGPRVKHVCRSASIVLGQPLATFPQEPIIDSIEKKQTSCNSNKASTCITCNYFPEEQSLDLPEKDNAVKNSKSNIASKEQLMVTATDTISQSENDFDIVSQKIPTTTHENTEYTEQNKSLISPLIVISAEYMDNFQMNYMNFGLISSESFSVRSVCLHCGSGGQEGLIHCIGCCEPFHLYCIDDSWMYINLQGDLAKAHKRWSFPWTCSRCTVCHRCGNADKQKIACKKCYYYYHLECFNLELKDYNQSLICSTCLRCEDCNSDSTSLVCNIAVCLSCFKLKNKENPCSVCLTYVDTNVNTKMLQCGQCRSLIHAKCNQITDEECSILCFLPRSIFKCRNCSFGNTSYWKDTVNILLKNGYHKVLRYLSKNIVVKEIIRKGVSKNRTCTCKVGCPPRKVASSENFQISLKESKKIDADISLVAKKTNVEKNINNMTEILQNNIKDEIIPDNKGNDSLKNTCGYSDQNIDNFDITLKNIRKKFCIKECSVRIKNCAESKGRNMYNRILRDQNNENEKRPFPMIKNEKYSDVTEKDEDITQNKFCCKCDIDFTVSLLNIKKKINSNIYNSTEEFKQDVEQALKKSFGDDILEVFQCILREVFPWYNGDCYFYEKNAKNYNLMLNCELKNNWEYTDGKKIQIPNMKMKEITPEYVADSNVIDVRQCVLCKRVGDGNVCLEGRLLYCGLNDWIHINCAFWSNDVYEDIDGSLQNVHDAINRSHLARCSACKETGASVTCCVKYCNKIYHYTCARDTNCSFSNNKTVYCPLHSSSASGSIINHNEFELSRPVFVAFDRKKKRYAEPSKIQYLIGALTVTNLGIFSPSLSDTEEAIIPSEFVCSRLYWSTVEPWKIVKYEITTSVLMPHFKDVRTTEKNFTVDHSLPIDEIDKAMMAIYRWKKDFEYCKMDDGNVVNIIEEEKDCMNYTDDEKVVSQVLEYLLEQICSKEVDENCEDEPQNTADLLPPELKDAIFEDLPHDLLDGISMQDIFPKLMSYEDVITMDLKTSDFTDSSEFLKDSKTDLGSDVVSDIDNYEFSQFRGRKPDIVNDDLWNEPKYSVQNLDDYIQNGKKISNVNGQQLKRSKSEVFPGIKKLTRTRNHQRSCSLTWSCKLDNTLTTNIKKRKMSCSKSVADISNNLFMVVDGSGDKSNMLQELRLPDGVLMAVGRSSNADCVTDAVREYKYCLGENTSISNDKLKSQNQDIEHGKENKCRIWQGRSQSRILQVDGADDITSGASDSDSLSYQCETNPRRKVKKTTDEPVKCDRCQCTYRTHTSYKRHLATCDFITTSESDSDSPVENDQITKCTSVFASSSTNSNHLSDDTLFINNSVANSELSPHLIKPEKYVISQQQMTAFAAVPSESVSTNCVFVKNSQNNGVCNSAHILSPKIQNDSTDRNDLIKNSQNATNLQTHINSENMHLHKMEHLQSLQNNKEEIIGQQRNITINQFAANDRVAGTFNAQNNNISQINVSAQNNVLPQKMLVAKVPPVPKQTAAKQKNTTRTSRARTCRLAPNRRTKAEKSIHIISQPTTLHHTSNSIHLPEIQNNSGPTVIIQHLSSPNLMPAYVEAFQHQTGQNLQCIATIVPNDYKPAQYIAQNSIVPGAFHVQSAESTNLISLPNNGLSVLSGLQIGAQPQPAVMGTLIQQSRPSATIQCGVMSTEQLVLGAVPTVDTIVTDSSGSMYFTSQPVYYGFETIVQNTVMSSQQFVSTTLPGVLASNSSYAATTTQVFQTSKIEPVVDMNTAGYILVNPTVPQVTNPIAVNPVMTHLENRCASITSQPLPDVQSTYSVQIGSGSMNEAPVRQIEPVLIPEQLHVEEPMPCIKTTVPNVQLLETPNNMEISNTQCNKPVPVNINNSSSTTTNSITLPVAPSVTETGIPMNIVNPIPQVTANTTAQISRPMNRVLPMQSAPPQRDFQKARSPINKVISLEPPGILNKLSDTVDKIQETLNNDVEAVQSSKLNTNDSQLLKLESASLKLVFQKQSQDGIYKISNKYISKNNKPIQITPMKQTKPKTVETVINVQNNMLFERKNNNQEKENPKNNSNTSCENNPNILYKVHSEDGFTYSSTSITDLWKKVFEAVQSARIAHNMPPLPESSLNVINGLHLLGLDSNGLRYLVEQLPGAGKCTKYKATFHKQPESETLETDDTAEIIQFWSAARCEPHVFKKEPYDMFSWLASRHRKPDYVVQMEPENASRRNSSVNLPMAMRFRQLKETSKHAVGVYRSNIHGRGLFCLRDIECGEMVIEYAGEVIRSTLTDKREKYYNSKGIGCYMFRVDDNLVIDATMKGNAARFINHSCDPNCYSRVLDILGHKHILIFALRKIMQGEELTYDYKFPFEEDKIPCTCGSKRCRKYLN